MLEADSMISQDLYILAARCPLALSKCSVKHRWFFSGGRICHSLKHCKARRHVDMFCRHERGDQDLESKLISRERGQLETQQCHWVNKSPKIRCCCHMKGHADWLLESHLGCAWAWVGTGRMNGFMSALDPWLTEVRVIAQWSRIPNTQIMHRVGSL